MSGMITPSGFRSLHDTKILKRLAVEYQELNGTRFDVLDTPPTPVEFLRLVHIGRPVLINGLSIPARYTWTDEYLKDMLGDSQISVAVTPNGQADAVTAGPDGRRYFVEPHTQKMTIADLLLRLQTDDDREVFYLQSQNGNLFKNASFTEDLDDDPSEFEAIRKDVPNDIQWASEALGKSPDAVNIWIGDGRSVTSIHSDPYENIYTVVRGAKHFTLFPPTEGWCLQERIYPHATYTRPNPQDPLVLTPSPNSSSPVRWSSVLDPTNPGSLPPEASPFQITVHEGETLYLPAGWWHHVRQTGVTVALNWWYDMEIRGMSWVWLSFLRGMGDEIPSGNDVSLEEQVPL